MFNRHLELGQCSVHGHPVHSQLEPHQPILGLQLLHVRLHFLHVRLQNLRVRFQLLHPLLQLSVLILKFY